MTRRRVVEWEDPAPGLAVMPTMSGLDYLRTLIRGELPPPPIMAHLNMTLVDADVGTATFVCEPDESHYNPIGTVHGGYVCTVLDTVTACAVHSTLPQGMGYTSLDLNVSYLRAVTRDSGLLTARGWVTRPGRRAAFSQGEIRDGDGKVVATATSTCLVFPR